MQPFPGLNSLVFPFQSDEEETEEVKDTKKNTNVDNDEKGPVSSRRRSQETRHEDTKVTGVIFMHECWTKDPVAVSLSLQDV